TGGAMGSVVPADDAKCRRSVPLPIMNPPSIVRRSEGVIRGNAISRPVPAYPMLARTAHVEGDVQMEITIDENGDVATARVISGHPLLQQASLNAAREWKFNKTALDGRPVKVQGVLTFRFKL